MKLMVCWIKTCTTHIGLNKLGTLITSRAVAEEEGEREIVFRSRRLRGKAYHPAPSCSGIQKVDKQTILGVVVNSKLTATDHISYILDSCSSLLHALRVLRTHGLPSQSLKDVFHAIVIGKLIYCAPAWHGFYLASDYSRLNSFLRRAVKLGYYDKQSTTIIDLFDDADDAFFRKVLYNKQHVIHTYLPNDLTLYILCVQGRLSPSVNDAFPPILPPSPPPIKF